jgi:hypothetical protein
LGPVVGDVVLLGRLGGWTLCFEERIDHSG